MANLKKYQIDALKQEIYNKISKEEHPERTTKEYKKYVDELTKKTDALNKEIKEIEKEVSKKKEQFCNLFDHHVYVRTDMKQDIEKEADNKFNVHVPNTNEIERTIILTDLEGSENIVDTVLEKLGY